MTKKYKNKRDLCRALSIVLTLVPILVYVVLGFMNGEIHTTQKVSLGLCLFLALIFTIINVVFKHRIRCTIWIVMIGLYVCVSNIIPLLFMLAFGTALDEFVLSPLERKYNNLYIINKEIDKH